jgi:hypothetical protein
MAFQRLGRRLEDGVAAYLEAYKTTMLDGVDIITPKQADKADAPWLAIYSGVSVPYSDSDRRGEIRGPMRTTLRVTIAEHMNGTLIDHYCGEFVDIITRTLRIGQVVAHTSHTNKFKLTYSGLATPTIVAGDLLRIEGKEFEVVSLTTPAPSQYEITITSNATLHVGDKVWMETYSKQATPEYTELINYLNALGTISVHRIAFVSESANVQGDLRMHDYEFEIDAVNSPGLA